MPVTNYYTVAGTIIGEQTTGSGRIDYLTDALGSVTATVDQTGTVQNTYRYMPYGALLAKTGTAPDPKFGWVGSMGYRQTAAKHSDKYVRARHFETSFGAWSTIDPDISATRHRNVKIRKRGASGVCLNSLFGTFSIGTGASYIYVGAAVVTATDASGLKTTVGDVPSWAPGCDSTNHITGLPNAPNAVTGCNGATGKTFTVDCNRNCDAPCTDAHEGQHRNDFSACCAKLGQCISTNPANPQHIRNCTDRYNAWVGSIMAWSDCRSYNAGLDCRLAMKSSLDCPHCPSSCCAILDAAIANDRAGINNNCSGVNPWGRAPAPCPF